MHTYIHTIDTPTPGVVSSWKVARQSVRKGVGVSKLSDLDFHVASWPKPLTLNLASRPGVELCGALKNVVALGAGEAAAS